MLSSDRTSAQKHPKAVAKPEKVRVILEKRFETLFEIGTGWLGWSAADTWAATPSEILVAQRGHLAKLKAKLKVVNGVADKPEYDPLEEVSPEEVQAGLAKLRSLSGRPAKGK